VNEGNRESNNAVSYKKSKSRKQKTENRTDIANAEKTPKTDLAGLYFRGSGNKASGPKLPGL
jgi:hypothetical protein